MRTITKFRRSTRGLSPIFATLILIAIAVIAGIVVYMFTSGMLAGLTGGGGAGQEKMAIQAVAGVEDTTVAGAITLYAQSQGGGPIAIDSVIVKDAQGVVREVVDADVGVDVDTVGTSLTKVVVTTDDLTMVTGNTYTVTIVSVAGGNFPSTSFKATEAP